MSGADSALLERDGPRARIDAVLADAASGAGRMLLIEGPPGIGKSSLLREARARATVLGMRTLHARGSELEREWPFGVVRQLLEPELARRADRDQLLSGTARRAVDLLGLPGASASHEPAADAQDASFAVLYGLYWTCANLAERGPVCLVIDDLQWVDRASLRFLGFLLPRLEDMRLAVLAAQRPVADPHNDPLRLALLGDPATELVRLEPLSTGAIATLLSTRGQADRAFVAAVRDATGGVPFLVLEMRDALRRAGVKPTAAAVDRVERDGALAVGRWTAERLERLSPAAGAVARAVAVLDSAEAHLVAELAGIGVTEVAAAADSLSAAGLLVPEHPLRFAHPLLRAGVYALLAPLERSALHRRAAALIDVQAGGGARAAEHLLATQPAADPWVVERLAELAERARGAGAPDSAVSYLKRALTEPPAPERRAALLTALGLAEGDLGSGDAVEHLRDAIDAAVRPEDRLSAALGLALVLAQASRYGDALEALEGVAALLPAGSSELRAVEALEASTAMLEASTARAWAARLDAARHRGDAADATRDELAVAALLAAMRGEPAETAAGLARAAIAAGAHPWPAPQDGPWFPQACVALLIAERYDETMRALSPAIARMQQRGESRSLGGALAHRAWLHLHRGDLLAAEADAGLAIEVTAQLPTGLYRVLAVTLAIAAATEQGKLEEAEALLDLVPGSAECGSTTDANLRVQRARLRLAQGHPEEALADALAAGEVVVATGNVGPGWNEWRSCAAAAAMACPERDQAVRLAHEELELARRFGARRTCSIALRACGLAEHGQRARALLIEAAELAGSHAPLERTRALVDLGRVELAAGQQQAARERLAEALDRAHRLHAGLLEREAREWLRLAGGRPRRAVRSGFDALTASERRVAELAAEGRTNREVAEELFVTARTVEGHLTRAFAKLGVSSRDHLAEALRQRSLTGAAQTS